jgi:hypothetical protein
MLLISVFIVVFGLRFTLCSIQTRVCKSVQTKKLIKMKTTGEQCWSVRNVCQQWSKWAGICWYTITVLFFCWISYRHLSIFIYLSPFLTVYPCFAFKKYTGTSTFTVLALDTHDTLEGSVIKLLSYTAGWTAWNADLPGLYLGVISVYEMLVTSCQSLQSNNLQADDELFKPELNKYEMSASFFKLVKLTPR